MWRVIIYKYAYNNINIYIYSVVCSEKWITLWLHTLNIMYCTSLRGLHFNILCLYTHLYIILIYIYCCITIHIRRSRLLTRRLTYIRIYMYVTFIWESCEWQYYIIIIIIIIIYTYWTLSLVLVCVCVRVY